MEVSEWLGEDNVLGIDIWNKKYRYGDETFDQWLDRVSGGDQAVREMIVGKRFLFGGRILANRGLDKLGLKVTYSNCYVMGSPKDSVRSIYDVNWGMAETYKLGGGCGVDLGGLAPKGAKVNNTAKTSSGAVSWVELFDTTTALIGQNGRRGALMVTMPCTHPDIEEFARLKTDLGKATKCNLSIRMTDAFMEAVEKGEKTVNTFHRPETGDTVSREIDCGRFFEELCGYNYDYGEPGILFWDKVERWCINSENPDYRLAGTNPCGEQPLPAGGSCLLGSINLARYVTVGKKGPRFDMRSFERDVAVAVRALNAVLEEGLLLHPLEEQREAVAKWMQIGLGIMGLADMLFMMGLAYGSDESVRLCDDIGKTMANAALAESARLAAEKGPCPGYDREAVLASPYIEANAYMGTLKEISDHGLRNTQLLTIAPTGTIATMLGVNGGLEPFFATHYTRTTKTLAGEERTYDAYVPVIQEYMDAHGGALPSYAVTAGTLDYRQRIAMQAVWQKHVDASISSTVNIPHDFPRENVKDIYMGAWKAGLKGVTVFRDGCKREGVLKADAPAKTVPPAPSGELVGRKRKLVTGCGNLHMSVFSDPATGEFSELFLSKGSTGGCNNYMNAVSRLVSLCARSGVPREAIVDQLTSCGSCPSYASRNAVRHDCSKGSCCPMAVGYALMEILGTEPPTVGAGKTVNPCPVCGAELTFEGGCNTCKGCGYSRCG